jgi:RimJ/RimL family protein N-acetyltransferase
MAAALAWFDTAHSIRRTVCMISPGNQASERVAAKLGYEPLGLSRYRGGEDVMRYAREV